MLVVELDSYLWSYSYMYTVMYINAQLYCIMNFNIKFVDIEVNRATVSTCIMATTQLHLYIQKPKEISYIDINLIQHRLYTYMQLQLRSKIHMVIVTHNQLTIVHLCTHVHGYVYMYIAICMQNCMVMISYTVTYYIVLCTYSNYAALIPRM